MDVSARLASFDWSRVGLVLLPAPAPSLPALVREHTRAPILIYSPGLRIDDDAPIIPDQSALCTTIPQLRAVLRGFLDELFDQEVAFLADDETSDQRAVSEALEAYREADDPRRLEAIEVNAHLRVEHVMASLDLLIRHPPVNHLQNLLRFVPAIVCGAGPSLDSQLDAIRAWRDRCLVLCVNTSWPALKRAGITPDAVVICEAKPVERSLAGMPFDRVMMIPGMHVSRSAWDLPWRRIAPAVSHEGAFGQWVTGLFGLEPAAIGGSSACLAAGVAYLLGCDPVILAGCDCAPQGGALYSSGAAFAGTTVDFEDGAAVMTKSAAKLGVEDVGLRREVSTEEAVDVWNYDRTAKIPSLVIYDGLRQWFEEVGETWRTDRELVNASVGGAHILNWRHVGVDTALSEENAVSPRDCTGEMIRGLDDHAAVAPVTVRRALEAQIAGARTAQGEALRGLGAVRRLAAVVLGLGDASPIKTTWYELERTKTAPGHVPIFERLVADVTEVKASRPDLAASCDAAIEALRDARSAQVAVSDVDLSAALLEAHACGSLEVARRKGDRPLLDVFQELFAEIERHCAELVPLLESVLERVGDA